jgi:hypothetical protein
VFASMLDLEPPARVRATVDSPGLVGQAPRGVFASSAPSPQTVEFRATLRLWHEGRTRAASPDPQDDQASDVLSDPVITTVLGMSATVDQRVRLDDGDLEIDVHVELTPRREGKLLLVEREVQVTSRRRAWLRQDPVEQVQAYERSVLARAQERAGRILFSVEGRLLALDLETRAAEPTAAVPAATLARPAAGASPAW